MTTFDAKFVVECLRAGIASAPVSELFSRGQSRLVQAFQERLDGGGGAMAVEGGYGQGKTHLLKHLAQLARRRGFVVSLVTLSKETPFHHWWHLYAEAVSQAERQDASHERGLWSILRRYKWEDEVPSRLHEFGAGLHPRLPALLEAAMRTRDGELQGHLLGDLGGQPLANPLLNRYYREITSAPIKLPPARLAQTGRDYFAFAGKLVQLAGYAGWVIFFDEFELVSKLSPLQRARAYANLAAFRQSPPLPGFEKTLAVPAFIPQMQSEYLIDGKQDLARLPAALRLRGQEDDARAAESSIRWLVEGKHALSPLSETVTLEVLDQIAGLHELAYGWKRRPEWGRFYVPSVSAAERMRTKVRYCVEALDLAHLYGEPPRVRSQEVALPSLAEDREYYASDEVVVEEVDR